MGETVHITVAWVLHQSKLYGRVAKRKPLLTKAHMKPRLEFTQRHVGDSKVNWKKVLWSDETKIELFGRQTRRKHTISTVKHGGGSIMLWGCFSAAGPGRLVKVEGNMNAEKYRQILEDNLSQSARELRLGRRFIFQQDNNPKHTAKATQKWFKDNKVNVLEWPSQSPDLNPIEKLWLDLKRAVHARSPSNLTELELFCKEEWRKIALSRCASLIETYPHRLSAVMQPKVHLPNTDLKGVNIYAIIYCTLYIF